MLYCEKCKRLSAFGYCGTCDNTALREATASDFCVLSEAEDVFAKALEGSFISNGIKYALEPLSNGVRSYLGLSPGSYIIYVPYDQFNEAQEIVDFFQNDETEDLRRDLTAHRSAWSINKKMQKKLRKKLRLTDTDDLLTHINGILCGADNISDDGLISSCVKGGHYISVRSGDLLLWFNSVTYEIFI